MDMSKTIETIPNQAAENTYIAENGLRHCKTCGEPIEDVVDWFGEKRKITFMCRCRKEQVLANEERERREKIENTRKRCFSDSGLSQWRFETDISGKDIIRISQNYVQKFPEHRKHGQGLLLYGPAGTGKTFASACIANALIDMGYTVRMATIASLVRELEATAFEERAGYFTLLNRNSLLIFDDLGIERNTDYMNEQVYQIINNRYNANLPFIVTTNLTREELQSPELKRKRIYDRILEKCHPIEVSGTNMRKVMYLNKQQYVKESLEGAMGYGEKETVSERQAVYQSETTGPYGEQHNPRGS